MNVDVFGEPLTFPQAPTLVKLQERLRLNAHISINSIEKIPAPQWMNLFTWTHHNLFIHDRHWVKIYGQDTL